EVGRNYRLIVDRARSAKSRRVKGWWRHLDAESRHQRSSRSRDSSRHTRHARHANAAKPLRVRLRFGEHDALDRHLFALAKHDRIDGCVCFDVLEDMNQFADVIRNRLPVKLQEDVMCLDTRLASGRIRLDVANDDSSAPGQIKLI